MQLDAAFKGKNMLQLNLQRKNFQFQLTKFTANKAFKIIKYL